MRVNAPVLFAPRAPIFHRLRAHARTRERVRPRSDSTRAMQNLWQLVFVHTPLTPNPSYISLGRIFVPCSLLLLASWAAGLKKCSRILFKQNVLVK